jgi:hypothetical protein
MRSRELIAIIAFDRTRNVKIYTNTRGSSIQMSGPKRYRNNAQKINSSNMNAIFVQRNSKVGNHFITIKASTMIKMRKGLIES